MATPITDVFKNYKEIDSRSILTISKDEVKTLQANKDFLMNELENTPFPQPVGEAVVILHDIVSAKISQCKKLRRGE